MSRHHVLVTVLASTAVASAGCATYTTHVSPTPTPKGKLELGVNAGVLSLDRGPSRQYLPSLEMTVRYGLSDRVDIGGKASFVGGELNSKVSLVQGSTSVAILPGSGLGIGSLGSDLARTFHATFYCPVLIGFAFGDTEIVTGPKPFVQVSSGTGPTMEMPRVGELLLSPGALFGVRFLLTDDVALFPEVDVHLPYDVEMGVWMSPVFQVSLAVQFAAGV